MREPALSVGLLLGVFHTLAVPPTAAQSGDLQEDWRSAKTGVYRASDGVDPIAADAGKWLLGDTVSNSDECGPTQNTAEVFSAAGDKALRLTSVGTDSDCSDNIWVVLLEYQRFNRGFSIPISDGSTISFRETGSLTDPESADADDYCYALVPPCGDTVSLELVDSRGNRLFYILQRAVDREETGPPPPFDDSYREIQLDPDAGVYERDVFADFGTIPNFLAEGARIVEVEFRVDERGTAILDALHIGARRPRPCVADLIAVKGPFLSRLIACSAKFAKNPAKDPDHDSLEACEAKARSKFSAGWSAPAAECGITDPADEAAYAIETEQDFLFATITRDWDPASAPDRSIRAAALKAASRFVAVATSLHARNARKPDPEKHDAALEKAEARFLSALTNAIGKAERKGFDYTGPSPGSLGLTLAAVVDELVATSDP